MSRSEMSRCETAWSKKVWVRNVLVRKVQVRNVLVRNVHARNILVQKVWGRNFLVRKVWVWIVCVRNVKVRNVRVQNVRVQKVWMRNALVRKIRVLSLIVTPLDLFMIMSLGPLNDCNASLISSWLWHFLSLFMIVTLPESLWLWHTSWLWNFLLPFYDCDTPWGLFIIVAFFYYQLNLIDDSLTDLTDLG